MEKLRNIGKAIFRRSSIYVFALALLTSAASGYAATTYNVYNVPDMFLYAGIDTTQTNNIRVTGPIRNRVVVSYPALSEGVLEITHGSQVEHVYYSRATVDPTTKVITLTGTVIRDLCWNTATTYVGCGNGQSFSRGAQVRLVDDARLFNLAAKLDKLNTTTGSGAFTCGATSQPCIIPGSFTTAQRDAFTYSPTSAIIRNSTLDALQFWNGASWLTLAVSTGSFVNASDTVAGKVEITDLVAIVNHTSTGATGAINVLTPRYLTASGSAHGQNNSAQKWLLAQLNGTGVLSASIGGLGRANAISGALLIGQGSGAVRMQPSGTNGNYLKSDGFTWRLGSGSNMATVYENYTLDSYDPAALEKYDLVGRYTIPAGRCGVGTSYDLDYRGTLNNNDTATTMQFVIGSNTGTILTGANSVQDNAYFITGRVTCLVTGVSGKIIYDFETRYMTTTTRTTSAVPLTVDTTAAIPLRIKITAGGGGSDPHIKTYHVVFSRLN